ncbi:MAG: dihydrolipoyllysine-residue acetyltransferase [Gammaproteobacteria bacterium]|nr:dihydrolipoyllysine-residue acetyltransferase [Gammaproteobacteria bacterium]
MSTTKNVTLPDIGDFDQVEVIEILVSIGDHVEENDSIITLENDKATMEIPAPFSGKVASVDVKVGEKISKGGLLATFESDKEVVIEGDVSAEQITKSHTTYSETKVNVPDIGDLDQVEVIEILAAVGDIITKDQAVITLESDKASMEIPSTAAGKVTEISLSVGDKVSAGSIIMVLETQNDSTNTPDMKAVESKTTKMVKTNAVSNPITDKMTSVATSQGSHASPSIRKLARELGVNLSNIQGSGQKSRILSSDLKDYVKQIVTGSGPIEGDVEVVPLSRIKKLSGKHLAKCWDEIPHVTQFDEVNIEQMEEFRSHQKARDIKLSPLVFIMKAVVQVLKQHPHFNASLDESGENLLVKQYYNLGIAMDTPEGLIVPVIRDVGKKSLIELADELAEISTRARESGLRKEEMQGAGFTISSLGGIGGTQFTPIINSPEVAILGVSRTQIKPNWNGDEFIPTATLPLALSYDHRVIDGVQGARFMADLNQVLKNIMEILL